jgi:hypothetical protein
MAKGGTRAKDHVLSEPPWAPDAANPSARHRLAGLEPDNLLAFMALIGLLRALEEARPDWRPRAFWDVEAHPWRPSLTLEQPHTQAEVADAAAEGINALGARHAFLARFLDVKLNRADYRALHAAADGGGQAVLDALVCDGAVKDDGTLWPTPFCLLFGQGHQHFLDRFHDVPSGVLPGKLAKLKSPPDLSASHYLATALFRPWQRIDPTDGFRWDPVEDRRYALRAGDPSGDAATTQHGANRLAAIALPLFPTVAILRRGEARLLAAGTRYNSDGGIAFTWPIWSRAAALAGISALLAHPMLGAETPDPAALPTGIVAVQRARRISVGKFFCVTSAERVG